MKASLKDPKVRALVLLTDAHGGHGGIAKFNRDLLDALSSSGLLDKIVVLPRILKGSPSGLPARVHYREKAARGKLFYVLETLKTVFRRREYRFLICGHINLLPLAVMAKKIMGNIPIITIVHGVEVWQRPGRTASALMKEIDFLWAVSDFTRTRLLEWAGIPSERVSILPNCVDLDLFRSAERNKELMVRLGLENRKTLLTLARLDSRERYKGIDEILGVMPVLLERIPNLVYLICGDGDDRPRLEKKVAGMGLGGHVVFTGYVDEKEKAEYYRLADAFAMPGRGEGFGIVYLEALACGTPAVGSVLDGSRDALLGGKLGVLVNPQDPQSLIEGLLTALRTPRGVPELIRYFSKEEFTQRVHGLLARSVSNPEILKPESGR